MGSNLPFDINGFKKFLIDNFNKSRPSGYIGGEAFERAKKINPKAIANEVKPSDVEEALSGLFGKTNPNSINEAVSGIKNIKNLTLPTLSKANKNLATGLLAGELWAIPQAKHTVDYLTGFKNYRRPEMGDAWNQRQFGIYTKNFLNAHPSTVVPKIVASNLYKEQPKPQAQPKLQKVNMQPMGGKGQGLPPLPNVAPAGSYPTYEQILKDAGIPIQDNFQPNQAQAGQYAEQAINPMQTLADRLGMGGYTEPNIPSVTKLASDRLQQIRDYLGKYSPEQYMEELRGNDSSKQRNRALDMIFGTGDLFAQNKTDLDRQADLLKYLQSGYETDMGLTSTAKKLAEADAMSKLTGLPSTWFEDPKEVMANLIRPQITSQGQIEAYKQLGKNQAGISNPNNAIKLAIAKMQDATKRQQIANQIEIAKLVSQGKLAPAMINALGGGMVDQSQLIDFMNALGNTNNYQMPDLKFDNSDSF